MTIAQLVITIILALAAVLSSVYAKNSAKSAEKAVEAQVKTVKAQVIWETLSKYGGKEMRDNIKLLFKWKDRFGDDRGGVFQLMINDPKQENLVDKQDLARRYIAQHYHNIWVLEKRGILDEDDVKEVAPLEAQVRRILLPLVETLERHDYDSSMYDFYRNIYNITDNFREIEV